MTRDVDNGGQLSEVHLVGLPLDLLKRAQECNADLMREFALIDNPHPDSQNDVPARLLRIVHLLRDRFAAFTAGPDQEMREARRRGEERIDVTFRLPVEAGAAAAQMGALLDEADEYCRRGELLTMATPPELVALRRWYLREFEAQLAGAAPSPWDDAHRSRGARTG